MSNVSSNETTEDVSSDDQMEHQDLISDEEHDHSLKANKLDSSHSSHNNQYNQQFKLKKKTATTRLVSYDDEDDDVLNGSFDDEASMDINSIASEKNEHLPDENKICSFMQELVSYEPSTVEPSVDKPYMGHGVELPSEPSGKCPRQMQEKVTELYNKMIRDGKNMNRSIQATKNFCNPSIYEKLLEFLDIDEKGTNYPPELYNPGLWGPDSYYEELAKAQRIEMERREKDKRDSKKDKPSVEKSQGAKKSKTKWDDPSANSSNPI